MKQVVGFPKSEGTRITAVALSRLQSRISGVTAIEQISTKAESIVISFYPAVKSWCRDDIETRAASSFSRKRNPRTSISSGRRGGVLHAIWDQDRAYNAVRADKNRKAPFSIRANSPPPSP